MMIAFIFILVALLNGFSTLTSAEYYNCDEFHETCPNGEIIEYPFYSKDLISSSNGSSYCGYPGLSATCAEEGGPIITLSNHDYSFSVPDDYTVAVVDVDIEEEGKGCSLPRHNFSINQPAATALFVSPNLNTDVTFFYNCTTLPNNLKPNLPCVDDNSSGRSVALLDSEIPKGFNWIGNCQEKVTIPLSSDYLRNNGRNYTEVLKLGTQLQYQSRVDCWDCEDSDGQCLYNKNTSDFRGCVCFNQIFDQTCPQGIPSGANRLIIGLSAGVAGSLLILLVLSFIYRRKCLMVYHSVISPRLSIRKTSPTDVELFLQNYGSNGLQRYRYSDIKKMTNFFEDTVGQGGYGCVFKGKLPDGRMVAVKVLNESRGNGEEFINEVATIGRTNHVNVVTLYGFCIEGMKRALVYEFMVNGSLEKYIYKQTSPSIAYGPALGWEKLYQIALGIARGLEYLHRGCNNRILHFDIKPHNILLDSDFVPKVSDFGLAKLSQTRDSIVSMVGARGTCGYIAPEVYCRNFGVVSYKSDVYSYGMVLFEMIGGRKNTDPTVENVSEVYFPHWIYNHLNGEREIKGPEETEINVSKDILDNETARRMIIVALWCIQAQPTNRPSMQKVAEMLEGSNEELQMPPNPSLDRQGSNEEFQMRSFSSSTSQIFSPSS